MPPQHKPSPSDEEKAPESQPEIAAGVALPEDEPTPAPAPKREQNEWERAGVRPPQAYR